jgi:cytochrome P450
MDEYQERARPFLRAEESEGYWVFTDRAAIIGGLQDPGLWSSAVVIPTQPDPPYRWLPIMLDPPEHTRWRQLLSGYFSPRRVKAMLAEQQELAAEIIGRIAPSGECDFVREVGHVYPSLVFVRIMGMETERLADFMRWEEQILRTLDADDPDGSIRAQAMMSVTGYFSELIQTRRDNPIAGADDVVSAALAWTLDGVPVSNEDILNCLLLLFLAGLDTVAGQFSYAMLHLGTHAEHRSWVATHPDSVEKAVEELLRAYPIVQTARKATRDAEFHGCPVRRGDTAAFPLSAAARDVAYGLDARSVNLERPVTANYAFGAGPHRCLGSHLARQEMAVLLSEWHRQIPEYEVVGVPTEHRAGVWGLNQLNLRWRVPTAG